MKRLLGLHMLLPPTPDLLEIFETERSIWPGQSESNSKKVFVLHCCKKLSHIPSNLRCPDAGYTQTMQVFHQSEKRFNLLLVRASQGRERETM
jgi:hypothetical protein